MSKSKQLLNKTQAINSTTVDMLFQKATTHIDTAKQSIQRTINVEMIKAYWFIGRDIVEEEQAGSARAEYGKAVLKQLSEKLQDRYKRGFGVDTLTHVRKFYLIYQGVVHDKKSDAARPKFERLSFSNNLSWTHYRALMRVKGPDARMFYEKEAAQNC